MNTSAVALGTGEQGVNTIAAVIGKRVNKIPVLQYR
jgi:hypothetical protein